MTRLLFDEPLSERLCELLADIFQDSLHVRLLGHGGAGDAAVWDLARAHNCLVVSKDEDFNRLAILRGAPPKFVWVRRGNSATSDIATLLRQRHDEIVRFDQPNRGDGLGIEVGKPPTDPRSSASRTWEQLGNY